jgi:GDPmannose 4,6-dehydratase
MRTALITGISGQTGSYLAEQLLDDGWAVHGLVREADARRDALEGAAPEAVLHEGDLADAARLAEFVDDLAPDAVFNLGGLTSVAASWGRPIETEAVTARPVAVLLDACRRLRDRTRHPVAFVQASSAEIFGHSDEVPQRESTPVHPVNPYGAAKAYGHHLVGAYRAAGLDASSCILFNHESPRRPETFVTRKITAGVARIHLGLETKLRLGNLDAVRDWGWAPDYARALALAAARPGDYVIATGVAHSVADFVALSFAAVGITDWRSLVEQDPAFMRPTDAGIQLGDASRAHDALGWSPTMDLESIVGAMVAHDVELLGGEAHA